METETAEKDVLELQLEPSIENMTPIEWAEWLDINGLDLDDFPTDEEDEYVVVTREEGMVSLFFKAPTFREVIESIDNTLYVGDVEMYLLTKNEVKEGEDPIKFDDKPLKFEIDRVQYSKL